MHSIYLAGALLAMGLTSVPLVEPTSTVDLVVKGTVTTEAGAPLHGANVTLEAIGASVGTDRAGTFRITVPARFRAGSMLMRVRAIGYAPQARTLSFSSDTIVADFALKQDVMRLEQVVVMKGAAAATLYGPAPSIQTRSQGFSVAGSTPRGEKPTNDADPRRDLRGEEYGRIVDNPFRSPRLTPLSTFGVDVDRAAYANVRRIIAVDRQAPPKDAVRIEEFINYFPYEYAAPRDDRPFAVQADVAAAPWAREHLLVRIGLQARTLDLERAPANNLVFLIDVSGSMSSPDKLPLLKQAFRLLVGQLREQDRIAIVVYAGSEGLALPSTSGANQRELLEVIDRLEAGGSTAGGAGIRLAYDIAKKSFIPGGNNRVILATDGDFNVGVTSNAELERMVEDRRREGTALTVLGFGAGNIKDVRMEMLADKGNGNYNYIDSALEARKVLVQEFGGTLVTVAKDVKLQVEFNPAVVAGYRLIGYENRLLRDEDFKDDTKDAGDMGAGHSVTALYEIIPVGSRDAAKVVLPDSLRYTRPVGATPSTAELMYVKFRYKQPSDSVSVPMEIVVPNRVTAASTDFRFAQAVAAFGMVLRDSEHKGASTTDLALELAEGALGNDRFGYRADFVKLVHSYVQLETTRTSQGKR